ncbi:sigma 54-interacting transcriptional regulator [Bdellovibrio bacteriovorus]|uniref:Transcriptional regulatory protein flbD n=1 Tax=Bdellovibrio bacteriovorus (strain ATCC 15356 / DSM 50701 / NCIMB 9529 / HD100) TaxID=264462 RepID=Q6MHX6_BDEBA|nr:sigma 54-interacting transcriptional regulator [Bdellovibrio bacteriovorus]AHZ83767.1 transcriptional regulator [Bdellovibrio bacteriovorus]BEV69740.1 Regulatory protein AtoC [Bdellovibrio bacteriovorus]CAE78206.1 Transcriptional regulatory protein flbD [Bdellovibrio bacteriovorus HD100]
MSYFDFDALHIEDRRMHEVKQLSLQLASTQASLLLVGEAGVGKTSLARYIYTKSRSARLYCLDCKNAGGFDFSRVDGGTLLIEDLDCASVALQNDLMKLVERADGTRPRFISTSRRDLRALVKQEQFRQDLFYKLAVVHLELPRLEDRRQDFQNIVNFILEVSQIMHGKSGLRLTAEGFDRLNTWNWPGNIRELENVLERAVVLAKSSLIGPESIQFEAVVEDMDLDFAPGMSLSEVEKRLIIQTLELTAQNRTRAAQMLGISIRTLRNKLNEYKEAGVL